jgi:hypothetical protein
MDVDLLLAHTTFDLLQFNDVGCKVSTLVPFGDDLIPHFHFGFVCLQSVMVSFTLILTKASYPVVRFSFSFSSILM